jgi:hypothetical protein
MFDHARAKYRRIGDLFGRVHAGECRRVARVALQAATCLLLWHGLASAQIPGSGLSNVGYDVGPNYHSTTADFSNTAFVSRYHDAKVRSAVMEQLQTMADSGASVVKTTLWQVGGAVHSWGLSFPLAEKELSNIETYARDVAMTRRRDGGYLDLQLTLGWLQHKNNPNVPITP